MRSPAISRIRRPAPESESGGRSELRLVMRLLQQLSEPLLLRWYRSRSLR